MKQDVDKALRKSTEEYSTGLGFCDSSVDYITCYSFMAQNPLLAVIPPVSSICPVIPHHRLKKLEQTTNFRQIWEGLKTISPKECRHFESA